MTTYKIEQYGEWWIASDDLGIRFLDGNKQLEIHSTLEDSSIEVGVTDGELDKLIVALQEIRDNLLPAPELQEPGLGITIHTEDGEDEFPF